MTASLGVLAPGQPVTVSGRGEAVVIRASADETVLELGDRFDSTELMPWQVIVMLHDDPAVGMRRVLGAVRHCGDGEIVVGPLLLDSTERRRERRAPLDGATSIVAVVDERLVALAGQAVDLSLGGIRICGEAPPLGGSVVVRFPIKGLMMVLPAAVVAARDGFVQLRFLSMPAAMTEMIGLQVRRGAPEEPVPRPVLDRVWVVGAEDQVGPIDVQATPFGITVPGVAFARATFVAVGVRDGETMRYLSGRVVSVAGGSARIAID